MYSFKTFALLLGAIVVVVAVVFAQGPRATYWIELPFANHLQSGMNEQDVFVAVAGDAYRVPADAAPGATAPLYAAADAVTHNPGSLGDVGPYPLGEALGISQAEWLAGSGTLSLVCSEGRGEVHARFADLVPDATYTVWQSFVATPVTVPFKALDLPLGAFDGTQNTFTTDGAGAAEFLAVLDACVPLSRPTLATALAIAYHSDGRTHGIEPGAFGANSHVQLFTFLPQAE